MEVLGFMLVFGLFTYVGVNQKKEDKVEQPTRHMSEWTPKEHQELMMQCRITCGENNVKRYDLKTGMCECKTGE